MFQQATSLFNLIQCSSSQAALPPTPTRPQKATWVHLLELQTHRKRYAFNRLHKDEGHWQHKFQVAKKDGSLAGDDC